MPSSVPVKAITGILLIFILIVSGCRKDSNPSNPDGKNTEKQIPPDTIKLHPSDQAFVNINDIRIALNSKGVMGTDVNDDGTFFYTSKTNTVGVVITGLWLGKEDSPKPLINITGYYGLSKSNYSSIWDTARAGLMRITPDMTKFAPEDYLKKLGFPVDKEGRIKLFGDEMYWASFHGTKLTDDPVLENPLPRDIRVTQAVYAYKRADLKNVLFIRYDITNTGSIDYSNLYAGYFSDTDLESASSNSTGFDLESAISYTYNTYKAKKTDTTVVAAFSFLESPVNDPSMPYGVSSHRMIRKHEGNPPGFEEFPLNSQTAVNALKGLSNDAQPMIDPVTKNPTKYAYTGDPYTGTGWIDKMYDTRNIINAGPFDLKSQETKTLVVVWICTGNAPFKDCLSKMRQQLQNIRSEKTLWE